MNFVEFYELVIDLGTYVAMVLVGIFGTVSFSYFLYRYLKGDDIPNVLDIEPDHDIKNNFKKWLNPFYFKHPFHIFMPALLLFGAVTVSTLIWPVIIPCGLIWFAIDSIRKKNIHKKKMWEELKS
jgi:hypothetical protein